MNFRLNRQIRAPKVRLIGADGSQLGIVAIRDALSMAEEASLDLVEVAPNANPPVCKIIDYGKFRYDQTKREKESKKAQHQVRVKEIKVKPNIDDHDLETKMKRAKRFIEEGNKVKITCMFRGREMAHPQLGEKVVKRMTDFLEEVATIEAPMKMMGRNMTCVLAPGAQKGKKQS